MESTATPLESKDIPLPDETATEILAGRLAAIARRGDVIALDGDLGTGKTVFARAFIGALGGTEEVPSPTFTLVQIYELAAAAVFHFDLYRLADPEEAYELGIEEAFADGISLIEWPDRLGGLLPATHLHLRLFHEADAGARRAVLSGHGGDWPNRLKEAGLV